MNATRWLAATDEEAGRLWTKERKAAINPFTRERREVDMVIDIDLAAVDAWPDVYFDTLSPAHILALFDCSRVPPFAASGREGDDYSRCIMRISPEMLEPVATTQNAVELWTNRFRAAYPRAAQPVEANLTDSRARAMQTLAERARAVGGTIWGFLTLG